MKILFAALLGLSLPLLAGPSLAADEAECKTIWEVADANKDGAFVPEEHSKAADEAISDWGGFDTDGDGKLANAEFTEACKKDAFKGIPAESWGTKQE